MEKIFDPATFQPAELYAQACREQRLTYLDCRTCGNAQIPLRPVCTVCGETEFDLKVSTGSGEVLSFTRIHRAPTPFFRSRAPYCLVLVRLDQGFQTLMGFAGEDCRIGMRVRILFEAVGADGELLPRAVSE